MSDDSPFPPDKRGTNPRSLANLRPSKKGEQPRNPGGRNGRERSDHIVNFLERADSTELGRKLIQKLGMPADTPRIDAILQAEVIAGLIPSKGAPSRKVLTEHYGGKPRMQVDLSSEDGTMSPLGPDSVADALRAAIDERRRAKEQPAPADQEAPGDDTAGAK